jgi:hypothetical protein
LDRQAADVFAQTRRDFAYGVLEAKAGSAREPRDEPMVPLQLLMYVDDDAVFWACKILGLYLHTRRPKRASVMLLSPTPATLPFSESCIETCALESVRGCGPTSVSRTLSNALND